MNIKKNPVYYLNLGVFLLLSIYSLLVCINIFDMGNIDMDAGLCAVIVSMVLCVLMYLIHATRVVNILYSNPIVKGTLEVISTLIFLTLACVIRIYSMGEFELDIYREGIVILCMFAAYLTARMLNQFGFITLLLLTPWPYLISTYDFSMQELFLMAEIMGGIFLFILVLYAVRRKKKIRAGLMAVFVIAVIAFFCYLMNRNGVTSVYVEKYTEYLKIFDKMFMADNLEKVIPVIGRYYYIVCVMSAIIAGLRLWFGRGSADNLILFVVNTVFLFTVSFDLGSAYLYLIYPLLAIAASGALGVRPQYMDEEVELEDNLENVSVKYNKKDVTGLTYVDDSELDKMLDDLEKKPPYSTAVNYNPARPLTNESDSDEEIPIELQMYDSTATKLEEQKKEEAERLAAERAEAERLAAERAEAERLAAERAEAERVAAERAEAERLAAERAEAERVAAERAEAERVAAERAEAERVAAERAEAERVAAERAEAERLAAERAEAERLAAERAEAERLAAERAEAERLAAEKESEEERIERLVAARVAEILKAEHLAAAKASEEVIEDNTEPVIDEVAFDMPEMISEPEPEIDIPELEHQPEPEKDTTISDAPEYDTPVFDMPVMEQEEIAEPEAEVEKVAFEIAEPEAEVEEVTFDIPEMISEPEIDIPELEHQPEPEIDTMVFDAPEFDTPVFDMPVMEQEEIAEPEAEAEKVTFDMPGLISEPEPEIDIPELEQQPEPEIDIPELEQQPEAEIDTTVSDAPEFDIPVMNFAGESESMESVDEVPVFENDAAESVDFVMSETNEKDNDENVSADREVFIENPVVIKNPVSFNRNRNSEERTYSNRDYGYVQSKPMFETMASFLSNNQDVSFPQFETGQSIMDSFGFDNAVITEELTDVITMPENVSVQEQQEEVPVFEQSTNLDDYLELSEDVERELDREINLELPESVENEINRDINDFMAGIFEFSEDSVEQAPEDTELGFNAPEFITPEFDDSLLSGAVSDYQKENEEEIELSTAESYVEPEEIDLNMGETFDFAQAQSLSDFYDMESASMPLFTDDFMEPSEEETELMPENVNLIMEETAAEETRQTEPAAMQEKTEFSEETEAVPETEYSEEAETVSEAVSETVMEMTQPENDNIDISEYVYDYEEEPKKEEETKVNQFAQDDDFFDWSSVDESVYLGKKESAVVEEAVPEKVEQNDEFAEFVWTDEMIRELEKGKNSNVYVEDVHQEIAATAIDEPETADISGQEYEMPEDTSEFTVYHSNGSVNVTEEAVEEAEPQFAVFQSSGNFRIEEPEDNNVEEPQFEVFHSSGTVEEETAEEIIPTYKVYGEPEKEPEVTVNVTQKEPEKKPAFDNKYGDFEFDLDLPDFEPFDKNK